MLLSPSLSQTLSRVAASQPLPAHSRRGCSLFAGNS